MLDRKYIVGIVGASGAVGEELLRILDERDFPIQRIVPLASSRSAGEQVEFRDKNYTILETTHEIFRKENIEICFFSAGSSISQEYVKSAIEAGSLVIDNTSFFRMKNDVPLVVPEVNPQDIKKDSTLIANPNCSTIQAVVPLKPLDDTYHIKRIVYSTYQAVSGAGREGIEDLENGANGFAPKKFPYPIFNNCLTQIDVFMEDGYTKEEHKMIDETRKILNRPDLPITATTVRVPVLNCHSESINIELEKDFDLYDVRQLLQNYPSVIVVDDIEKNYYPIATKADGYDEIFVGRIRRDDSVKYGLNLWVVADNLRKGAASNAIQILENMMMAQI